MAIISLRASARTLLSVLSVPVYSVSVSSLSHSCTMSFLDDESETLRMSFSAAAAIDDSKNYTIHAFLTFLSFPRLLPRSSC